MKFSFNLLPITLLVLSIIGQNADPHQLPDSQAGKRVAAYITAFNSHDDKIFGEYLSDNLSQKSLAGRSMEDRFKMYHQMYDDLGRLELKRIMSAKDDSISVVMKGANGPSVEMYFQFESDEPRKINSMRVELSEGDDGQQRVVRGSAPGGPGIVALASGFAPVDNKLLTTKLEEHMAGASASGFTGALLVARNGQVLLENGYGLANRQRKIPFARETVFDIGSFTKILTRIAILQLAEKGNLGLEDPIAKYFKNVPADKAGITILQLMKHTAGIAGEVARDPEKITRDEMLSRVLATKLVSEPGKEEHYSNVGFSMLAAIIEGVSGQSYEQYVSEHIFKPAGMTRTGYVIPQWKADEITRSYANGQDRGSTFDYPHLLDGTSWSLRGNGGTLSTLGDMLKFHAALQADKFLSNKSRALVFPSPSPMMVGGNGIHFFVYRYNPQDNVLILAASTDADKKAMDLTRQITALIRGEN